MKLRCGRKQPQNIYVQMGDEPADSDPYIGVIFDTGRAEEIIDIVNGDLPPLTASGKLDYNAQDPC